MKSFAKSLQPKQNGQEVTELMRISTPDDRVYRYSYNLGILEFCTQRRENAMIVAARSPVKIQRRAQKYNDLARLENESEDGIAFPSVIDVAPATNCSLQEIEMRVNEQEKGYKVQQVLSAEETVNVCQGKTTESKEWLETNAARKDPLLSAAECVTNNSEDPEDKAFNAQYNLPPIEKFRRAARVLGVCLPPKELYCLQRRNGACEETEWSLEHRTLLRILNKRF